MSLLRLLFVSRTFDGAKAQPGRYRMSPAGRLPQFGPNHREADAVPESLPDSTARPSFIQQLAVRLAQWRMKRILRLDTSAHNLATALKPKRIAPEKSNLFARNASHVAKSNSSQPSPMQGELRLAKVQVVRNDLSTDDFEVVAVPADVRSKPSVTAVAPPARRSFQARAGGIWRRLTARLFVAARARPE